MKSMSASGPIGSSQPASSPRRFLAGRVPASNIVTAWFRYPKSRALAMNPALSLMVTATLPRRRTTPARRHHVRGGHHGLDDLDQLHHRRRVEEVQADHLLGPARGDRDLGDAQRARVGGQDRLGLRDPFELGEDLLLQRQPVGDRLHRRGTHPVQRGASLTADLSYRASSASRSASLSLPLATARSVADDPARPGRRSTHRLVDLDRDHPAKPLRAERLHDAKKIKGAKTLVTPSADDAVCLSTPCHPALLVRHRIILASPR